MTATGEMVPVYVLSEHLVVYGAPQTKALGEYGTVEAAIAAREAAYRRDPTLRGVLTVQVEYRPRPVSLERERSRDSLDRPRPAPLRTTEETDSERRVRREKGRR